MKKLKQLLTLPFELLALLRRIDERLKRIEEVQSKLEQCLDRDNHQQRMCVRTGHWNG